MVIKILTREDVVIRKHYHDGPKRQNRDRASDCEEGGEVPNSHEQLHVVYHNVSLIRCKCDCKETLDLTRLISYSVIVYPKRNIEAHSPCGYGVGLPEERSVD